MPLTLFLLGQFLTRALHHTDKDVQGHQADQGQNQNRGAVAENDLRCGKLTLENLLMPTFSTLLDLDKEDIV